MKQFLLILSLILLLSCKTANDSELRKIVYLHHSTGKIVWDGGQKTTSFKIEEFLKKIFNSQNEESLIPKKINNYSKKKYKIEELTFPRKKPYGWRNYPYDYYNIWVKHAGEKPYMKEPTLEILTKKYDIIVMKHCFPVSNIQADATNPNIDSDYKSLANYKLQYIALRNKMHEFTNKKFIVWTGAAQVKSQITEAEAKRAREFFDWVKNVWDQPNDNIFIWDFYSLQTQGELYFKEDLSAGINDSHPSLSFAESAANNFVEFLIAIDLTN